MSRNDSSTEFMQSPYRIIQCVVYGFVMVVGTTANGIAMFTYIKWRKSMFKTARDVLIFSLALADLVSAVFAAPFGFASSVLGVWTTGRSGCVWYGFLSTWTGLSAILQLTGIAAERYYTLKHPDLRWAYVCRKHIRNFVILSWLVSGLASSFPLVGWSKYVFEGLSLHCSIEWSSSTVNYASYCMFLLVFFFAIPLFLIIYFYINVYFMVKRMFTDAESLWGVADTATKQSYVAQVKMARQLVLLTGVFMFAWTPYAVMSFLSMTNIVKPDQQAMMLPAIFAKLSHVYNPVVYFFTFKRLRKRSLQLFTRSSAVQ